MLTNISERVEALEQKLEAFQNESEAKRQLKIIKEQSFRLDTLAINETQNGPDSINQDIENNDFEDDAV